MEGEIRSIIETKALALTGSRAICPQVVGESSDHDYIAWVPNLTTAQKLLTDAGFVGGESMMTGEICPTTKFISLKRKSTTSPPASVNVIATADEEFFKAYMLETRVATQLGLTVKSQRVQLFQAILYANG